jgi:ATP-dependent helicase/DNAse subunit B
MKIINGLNKHYQRQQIIQNCVQEAQAHPFEQYIYICNQPDLIEQYFFQYTHYLVNIQIMTWSQYLKQLQIKYHLTRHHLLSTLEWVYHLRQIFEEETIHCFQSDNIFPFIQELIPLMKNYELNQIHGQTDDSLKLQDFYHIYQSLQSRLDTYTHITFESMFKDVHLKETDHLIIEADHLYQKQRQDLIHRLSQTCDITYLYTYQKDERLFNLPYHQLCQDGQSVDQPTQMTQYLFSQNPTPCQQTSSVYTFVAPTPLQEVQQVVYTIYQKIADENLHYRDFTIIYPNQSYQDDLREVLDTLHMPHNLPRVQLRQYEYSYQLVLNAIVKCTGQTYHDIALELSSPDLDAQYLEYLNQVAQLDGHISPLEFMEFFKMTFPQTLQTLEKNEDQIHVYMMGQGQRHMPTHLFILGMNETILPQSIKDTALLLDEDIENLRNNHISTPMTTTELLGVHENDILRTLTMPYQTFTFSYAMNTLDGETLLPSSLYKQLTHMFTCQKLPTPLFMPQDVYYSRGGKNPDKAILNQNIETFLSTHNQPVQLSQETTKQLYSPYLSVSQIETYNKCPFLYFIQYGLGIYPLPEQKLLPNELGSLVHYVLSINIDQSQDTAELVHQYIQNNDTLLQKISQQPVNQFFIEQLIKDLHITLKVLKHFLKTSDFQIQYKEKKVQDYVHQILFKGFVDRIDEYDNYISIIDYKSSSKNIDLNLAMQGFQIQMLLYLQMVTKAYHKDPGAVLYFNTKKRILSVDQNMQQDIDEDEFIKQYRCGGYVIDDGTHQSIIHLDPTFDKRSSFIPVSYVKSRNEYKGQVLSRQQLDILFEKIEEHIYQLYQEMMEGHIDITPKGSDQKATHTQVNPCFYCPYQNICGFDVFYNDYKLVEFLDVEKILGGEDNAI